ncbi:thioredoxin-like protein [Ephemerocybe angulata]|uniref:Thioredoxin-like protein n=1 Tax=Ephemerocybe angulata TaxID=980116 RepID=A0A8H6HVZ1_9AGAR|nr:thioredoxin-like protein [Tulosesus angulatus]
MSSVKDIVESTIEKNPIVIFSKSYCPYCRRAKALLKEKFPEVEAAILELDERDDGADIQNYLATKTNQRTVPNIFIKQQHIGGCDDTTAAVNSGKIAGLLKA